jgi:hypothetical protein
MFGEQAPAATAPRIGSVFRGGARATIRSFLRPVADEAAAQVEAKPDPPGKLDLPSRAAAFAPVSGQGLCGLTRLPPT